MTLLENLHKDHQDIHNLMESLTVWCKQSQISCSAESGDQLRELMASAESLLIQEHLNKEEKLLFPELLKIGVSKEYGPIGVLLREHKAIRDLVDTISGCLAETEKGGQAIFQMMISQTRKLIRLIKSHCEKEKQVIYDIAERHISQKRQQELAFQDSSNTTQAINWVASETHISNH